MTTKSYAFSLRSGVIAPWTAPQTWGASIALDSISMYGVTFSEVSDRLTGDGGVNALGASLVSGKVSIEFGVRNLNVFGTLYGISEADSQPTSESLVLTQKDLPYFGINGQINHDSGAGAYELFVPKAKLMGDLVFTLQYGKFWTAKVDAEFIQDSTVYGFGKIISRATAASPITIPPA